MATKSRTNLKSLFETGDTLTQASFTDLIDSNINLTDTTAQTLASNLTVPNLAANQISADTGYITNLFTIGTLQVGVVNAATAKVSGDLYVSGKITTNRVLAADPHFEVYSTVTAVVTASAADTYVPIESGPLFDVSANHSTQFSVSGGSITWIGPVTAHFHINGVLSMRGNVGTSHTGNMALFQDGVEIRSSRSKYTVWSTLVTQSPINGVLILKPSAQVDIRLQINTTASIEWEIHSFNLIGTIIHYEN